MGMADSIKGKIIVCYPILDGYGGKFVATNLAFTAPSKAKNKRIAVLNLNLRYPFMSQNIASNSFAGIDDICVNIESNSIDMNYVQSCMQVSKLGDCSVEILKGTHQFTQYNHFTKEQMETIIETFRQNYDYTIIPVSSYMDNAGTVSAVQNADEILFICSNNIASKELCGVVYNRINAYKNSNCKVSLVCNMINEGSTIHIPEELKDVSIEKYYAIPYDKEYIDSANLVANKGIMIKQKSLFNKNSYVMNEFQSMANEIFKE